jgi:mRNA interferase RelE/StbE
MSAHAFLVTDEAQEDLEKIGEPVKTRILEKLNWFRYNFDCIRHSSLTGNLQGFFKLRVGDGQIVYDIDYQKKIVIIHFIDHRDKIYKRKI